ncbi:MAG TPA: hypothetical protein VFJ14_04355 [Nocardioidaceae bacterium]|nr:hypothetical protein [Nocardioidaceae bacterium]
MVSLMPSTLRADVYRGTVAVDNRSRADAAAAMLGVHDREEAPWGP